jgi:hypothetical protein
MKRFFLVAGVAAVLSGCGSTNPFMVTGDATDDGTAVATLNALPDAVQGDVQKITYSPGDGTITVEGIALDESQISSIYTRDATYDRPGYQAYVAQDDVLDRNSFALVAQSRNTGSIRAGVVVTGGQFNRVLSGNFAERDGNYTPPSPDVVQDIAPDTGLVSYTGSYAGLTNGGPDATVPGGTPAEITPGQPNFVTGTAFFNVDFADNSLNGTIYDRNLETPGGATIVPIPSIVLVATDIGADGTFEGSVEYSSAQGNPAVLGDFSEVVGTSIGTFGGVFGGPSADAVGGAVVLGGFDGPDDPRGYTNELEWGVFVADQCNTPDNTGGLCPHVDPQ